MFKLCLHVQWCDAGICAGGLLCTGTYTIQTLSDGAYNAYWYVG